MSSPSEPIVRARMVSSPRRRIQPESSILETSSYPLFSRFRRKRYRSSEGTEHNRSRLKGFHSTGEMSISMISGLRRDTVCIEIRNSIGMMVESAWFSSFINLLIIVNSIILCTFDPNDPDAYANQFIDKSEWFFQIAFTIEAILWISYLGFKKYIRDGWHLFDFVIVVIGWVSLSAVNNVSLNTLRIVRILRFLRLLRGFPGMVLLIDVFYASFYQLLSVIALIFFVFVSFGIIGVDRFKTADQSTNPGPEGLVGFRDILESWLTIFQIITREGWVDIMEWISAQFGNSSRLYFVILTLIGSLLFVNLIVAVLLLNYEELGVAKHRKVDDNLLRELNSIVQSASNRLKREKHVKKMKVQSQVKAGSYITRDEIEMRLMLSYEISNGKTDVITAEQYQKFQLKHHKEYNEWKVGCRIYRKALSKKGFQDLQLRSTEAEVTIDRVERVSLSKAVFEILSNLLIFINSSILATYSFDQSEKHRRIIQQSSLVFASIFLVECYFRPCVEKKGPLGYFIQYPLNILDTLIVHLGFFMILLDSQIGIILSFRMFRIFTLFARDADGKVVIPTKRLRKFLDLIAEAFSDVLPLLVILFIFMYVFTVTGLHLLGAESSYYNTLLRSFVTTFVVVTGEGWNDVMYEATAASPRVSVVYFIVVLTIGNFILLSIALAVLINSFIGVFEGESKESSFINDKTRLRRMVKTLKHKMATDSHNFPEETIVEDTLLLTAQLSAKSSIMLKKNGRTSFQSSKPKLSNISNDSSSSTTAIEGNFSRTYESNKNDISRGKAKMERFRKILVDWIRRNDIIDLLALSSTIVYCGLYPFVYDHSFLFLGVGYLFVFAMEMGLRLLLREWETRFILDCIVCAVVFLNLVSPYQRFIAALRPIVTCRFIHWHPKLQHFFAAIKRASVPLLELLVVTFIVIFPIGISFVALFGGKFHECMYTNEGAEARMDPNIDNLTCFDFGGDVEVDNCPAENMCVGANITWGVPINMDFDNIQNALGSLLEMSTLEMWIFPMIAATRVTSVGHLPEDNNHDVYALAFVAYIIIVHLFLMQLFVAVLIETFIVTEKTANGENMLTSSQKRWVDLQTRCILQSPRKKEEKKGPFRSRCFRIVESVYFDYFISLIVVVDTAFMVAQHLNQPEIITTLNLVGQFLFGGIYILEFALMFIAHGRSYFKSFRNLFNFFIVAIVIVSWISFFFNINFPDYVALRVFRLAFALRRVRSFMQVLRTALFDIVSVLGVFLFWLYFLSAMALDLFPMSERFKNMGVSMLTLYEIAVGDDWNAIMHEVNLLYGFGGGLFVVAAYFLLTLMTVNLFIWVMLESFENEFVSKALGQSSLTRFRKSWNKVWRLWTQKLRKSMTKKLARDDKRTRQKVDAMVKKMVNINYIAPEMVPLLLEMLKPPLGITNFKKGRFTRAELLRIIHLVQIPITQSGMVNYNALLFALSDFRYAVNTHEHIPDDLKHLSLQLTLNKNSRKKYKLLCNEANPEYYLSHYMAARVIQKRFVTKYLKREEYTLRDVVSTWSSLTKVEVRDLYDDTVIHPSGCEENRSRSGSESSSNSSIDYDTDEDFFDSRYLSTLNSQDEFEKQKPDGEGETRINMS